VNGFLTRNLSHLDLSTWKTLLAHGGWSTSSIWKEDYTMAEV